MAKVLIRFAHPLSNSPTGLLAGQLNPLSELTSAHQSGGPAEYPLQEPPTTEALKTPAASHQKESARLGLFVVKRLSKLLQASTDIESVSGKGTLVRLRFLSNKESITAIDYPLFIFIASCTALRNLYRQAFIRLGGSLLTVFW